MKKLLHEFREIVRGGAMHILSGSILVKAITMISSILIARFVDKNDYAYYTYVNNFYQYISLLDGLGLGTALLIFCNVNMTPEKKKAYFNFALRLGAGIQLLAAAGLCIAVAFIPLPFPQAKKYIYLQVLLPAISFVSHMLMMQARVDQKNKIYSFTGVIRAIVVLAVGTTLVWFLDVYGIIASNYLSCIVGICFVALFFKKFLFSTNAEVLDREEKKKYIKTGISLIIASFFSSMMPTNETFLVNNIIQDEVVIANFKIAGLFPQQLLLITGALMTYYFPVISAIKDPAKQWSKIKKIGAINFVIVIFVAGIGALLTPFVIRLLYGTKYVDAIPLTYAHWLMRTVNAAIRMVPMNLLPAVGFLKFNSFTAMVSCITQTILDYILISFFGVTGAVYGAVIVYLLSAAVTWWYIRHVLKKRIREEKKYPQTNE